MESFLNKGIISFSYSSLILFLHKLFTINLFPLSWIVKSSTSFLSTWYLSPLIEGPMAIIKLFFLEPIPSSFFNVFEMSCFLIPFNPEWQAAIFLVFISAISIGIQSAVYIHKLWDFSFVIKQSAIFGLKFNVLSTWITLSLCTCCASVSYTHLTLPTTPYV